MNRMIIIAGLMVLAGCAGPPRVTVTSADPHSIQLFVQSARLVPLQDVEDRAMRHCADQGLVSRRAQTEWVNDASMIFRFECTGLPKATPEKLVQPKVIEPPAAPPQAPPPGNQAGRKQAAWMQANAMSPGWMKCISDSATRMARASSDHVDIVAVAVATNCSQWERDIHEVLQRAGEDDGEFQADLHRQIIEFAKAKIVSVRASASASLAVN